MGKLAAQASRQNGKLGGRPVSDATLRAQKAKEMISRELDENLKPIVDKAIDQAKQGDKFAREWLSDRAWGKATQPLSGPLDQPLFDNEQYQAAQQAVAAYLADTSRGDTE